ncbi:hypothetical protein [Zoogloea sp.]|uniref:hypothetical protein n=1 Tax=Zoogloea sp. TaxID=49181 RepID=UPI0035B177EC
MVEHAKITFYKISECGYYRRGTPSPDFGAVPELLRELLAWSQGRPLVETKVFEPADGQDLHPAYLLDIRGDGDSWLVTTWNQTPSNEAGVASVKGESNVGAAQVVMNSIEEGSIPGFATYFWFIPSRGCFASIRFQHLWTGQKSLQCYMESYMSSFSSHVVTEEGNGDELEILGYAPNPGEEPVHVSPRFRTSLVYKPGETDVIRNGVESIRKIVRKTALTLTREADLAKWQQFLRWTKLRDQPAALQKVRVQYEISTGISLADLDAIIHDWNEQHDREWDDYGFCLKGESQKIRWLSHSLARSEFDLDVTRDNDEVVSPASLLAALADKRAAILRVLD